MESEAQEQNYFCHSCKVTSPINPAALLCPRCGSDFLQLAQMDQFRDHLGAVPSPFMLPNNPFIEFNNDEQRRFMPNASHLLG